jgi:hypothetical protein
MNAHGLATIGILETLWGVIGPLVGVVIGARLARSRQHKSQLLESKMPKYRELCREDWERLQNVLLKMARQNRVIPNDIIGPTLHARNGDVSPLGNSQDQTKH